MNDLDDVRKRMQKRHQIKQPLNDEPFIILWLSLWL